MPVLCLFVSLVAGAASAGDLGGLVAARAPEVQREVETALRRMVRHARTGASPKGRRLMDLDVAALCTDNCWEKVTKTMTTVLQLKEDPQCGAEEHSQEEEPEQDGQDGEDEMGCMFDICAEPEFEVICDPGTDLSVFGFDRCMIDMLVSYCDGICHASCQLQSSPARQMFCSPEVEEEDEEELMEEQMEEMPSLENFAGAMDFYCLYNPNKNFYCMQKYMEWKAAGAFEGGLVDEFPDPSNIDCTGPTGRAIEELGCCMASLFHDMEEAKMMTMEEVRVAQAVMHHCGNENSFNFCIERGNGSFNFWSERGAEGGDDDDNQTSGSGGAAASVGFAFALLALAQC